MKPVSDVTKLQIITLAQPIAAALRDDDIEAAMHLLTEKVRLNRHNKRLNENRMRSLIDCWKTGRDLRGETLVGPDNFGAYVAGVLYEDLAKAFN